MSDSELWISFQLCDSAFPGGCLANSQGLESALHHGLVERNNPDSVLTFISMSIEQAIWMHLPFIRTAHLLVGQDNDQSIFWQLDSYFHAIVSNDVARRASINQGKCFLRAIRDTFPSITDHLDRFLTASDARLSCCYRTHFAPLFGITCGLLKISLPLCDRMFLRMLMRDIVSSATRLSIIGPMKGSHLQASMTPVIEKLLSENQRELESSGVEEGDANNGLKFFKNLHPVTTVPILEFVQSRHDLMYTRLFNT